MTMQWENTRAALHAYCQEAVDLIGQRLLDDDHFASGQLIDTLSYHLEFDEDEIVAYLDHEDYLKYIESGRQPGTFPPPQAIKQWIEVKPVEPYPDKNGKLPTVDQLAFLIGRKIKEEGIAPDPVIEDVIKEMNQRYETIIQEAIEEDVVDTVKAIMMQSIW